MKIAALLLCLALAAYCLDQGDLFNTDSGAVKTTPIYDSGFSIEGSGKVIQIDPSSKVSSKGLAKADVILLTQDSPDHLDPAAIAHLSKKNTAIIAPNCQTASLQHCTALGTGETVSVGDISIEAVAAYQLPPADAKPKGSRNGYVLTFPGLRIYISGDTAFIPEMKKIKNIDIAFLSVGTPDTLSVQDAASTIRQIKPKTVYPNHYRQSSVDAIKVGLVTPGTELRIRNWY